MRFAIAALMLTLAVPAAAQTSAQRRMTQAYAKTQAVLPATLKPTLAQTQTEFLASLKIICPQSQSDCLTGAYNSRAGDLQDALPRRDAQGRRFVSFKSYEGADTAVMVQIANPRNDAERHWNAAAAEASRAFKARFKNPPGEGRNEYRFLIEATGPGFIESILSWRGGSRWGTARPLHWSLTLNRELAAADLFARPDAAFNAIATLAQAKVEQESKTDATLPGRIPTPAQFRAQAADLDNWIFSQDELWLYTDPVPPDLITTLLPWRGITPLLKPDAPLDPSKLRWLD